MKKTFFSILAAASSLFLLSSCGSDDPEVGNEANYETNTKVEKVMVDNYYWEIKTGADKYKETPSYFESILNSTDKISWIKKTSEISTETTYDVGFDYGANRYSDGKIYYIIYYVRPNTSAANDGLARGHMISKVNNTALTEENKLTLLKDAAKEGKMELTVLTPANGRTVKFTITTSPMKEENPIYQAPDTNPIITAGTNNVGYFVYNAFDKNYDKELIEKLQSFNNKIQYLVIDLRYNVGGGQEAARTLASAIVKNRSESNVFLINQKRTTQEPYNFINSSASTSIPALGDQLKKVYVITGQNTQGIADAFINSLRPYLGDDLVVAGEESVGTNITVINQVVDNIWQMSIVTGKWADKNDNSTFNTVPTILANDVNRQVVTVLQPLGNPAETILAAVIANINGQTTTVRSLNESKTNKMVSPSLNAKAKLYRSAIE